MGLEKPAGCSGSCSLAVTSPGHGIAGEASGTKAMLSWLRAGAAQIAPTQGGQARPCTSQKVTKYLGMLGAAFTPQPKLLAYRSSAQFTHRLQLPMARLKETAATGASPLRAVSNSSSPQQ